MPFTVGSRGVIPAVETDSSDRVAYVGKLVALARSAQGEPIVTRVTLITSTASHPISTRTLTGSLVTQLSGRARRITVAY